MIPWLLVAQLISAKGQSLSQQVAERMAAYPCSGEINRRVDDAAAVIAKVEQAFASDALNVDRTDGLSVEFENWRFNLRMSNTEPVIRLNVESRADTTLMQEKLAQLLAMVEA
jgi:phosphomannomutase